MLRSLFGNPNGKKDGVCGLMPIASCVDTGRLHHGQSLINCIQKEAHILNNKSRPVTGFGAGRQSCQKRFHIFFCHCNSKPLLRYIGGSLTHPIRIVLQPQQSSGVPFSTSVITQKGEDVGRKSEQAQLIGDGRLRLPQFPGRLLLGNTLCTNQLSKRSGLFQKVQISSLKIFYQSQQSGVLIIDVNQDAGYLRQPCQSGSAQPALSGN